MAVESGRITVGTAATIIPATCFMPWSLQIHNDDNTDAVFIGGSAVGTATGLQLQKLESFRMELAPLDYVYAISSKNGHTISFMKFTRAC